MAKLKKNALFAKRNWLKQAQRWRNRCIYFQFFQGEEKIKTENQFRLVTNICTKSLIDKSWWKTGLNWNRMFDSINCQARSALFKFMLSISSIMIVKLSNNEHTCAVRKFEPRLWHFVESSAKLLVSKNYRMSTILIKPGFQFSGARNCNGSPTCATVL